MAGSQQAAPDLVGTIFIELTDRRTRDLDGFEIENLYRRAISEIPGVERKLPQSRKDLRLERNTS